MIKKVIAMACIGFLSQPYLGAWGVRGHTVANLAAVEGIPQDGPAFLRAQKAYIGHLGTIPDTWRSPPNRISESRKTPTTAGTPRASTLFPILRIRALSSRFASTTSI